MCSVGARGLWIDMICIMHQGSPYGYLKVNGKVIHAPNLSRMVGAPLHETEGWLQELGSAGVFSVDADECIYSPRMVRDEEIRNARASGGVLGGNPALKRGGEKVNLPANLEPTPSSSSSSSPSGISMSGKPDVAPKTKETTETARRVIDFLNAKTGKAFRPVPANINFVVGRLKEGATEQDCKSVIARKTREWKGTEQAMYLRPETLFNATKFAQYVGELVEPTNPWDGAK